MSGNALLARPFSNAWRYRELIRAVTQRELAVRFRTSIMSWIWAIFAPLTMLVLYVIVFSGVIELPSARRVGSVDFALSIFSGLVVFNLFAELLMRAPLLLNEHKPLLRQTIFPAEALAWIALLRALAYAGIAVGVLVLGNLAIKGSFPATLLLLPLIVLVICLFMLGMIWFLAALGAFTSDISFLMSSLTPVFIFASPVFYTLADVPERFQWILLLNPLAGFIEMIRAVVLHGVAPDPTIVGLGVAGSLVVFYGGYYFFSRYRSILVDVL